jgi:hypothetical protein
MTIPEKIRQKIVKFHLNLFRQFLTECRKTQVENITDYYNWFEIP